MKKKYEKLELEIIKFDAEDVITTSNPDPNGGYEEEIVNE